MSTTFTLIGDESDNPRCLALRCWVDSCTIRFAFPRLLIDHLMDVEVIGDNGEVTTLGELFINTTTVDFLEKDVAPRDHLGWGTLKARELESARRHGTW